MRGRVKLGRKTKELIPTLEPGEIAVIAHEDLDEVAAKGLRAARVSAVINTESFMTGRYPNPGPGILAEAGVQLIDRVGDTLFDVLQDGDEITIDEGAVVYDGHTVARGHELTHDEISHKYRAARYNLVQEIDSFVENTLEYASREKDLILGTVDFPSLPLSFVDRSVVVVVRGHGYREDLRAVRSYIEETEPILVGVDGGADALLDAGHVPDMIIGDMDSVSDRALQCGAELIVHAYPDGSAPGQSRLLDLGLASHTVASVGTSEDLALLMAYELGASLIVAVGTHSNIVDFLEKGRPGMASTFLVRLKVGNILVDAKGLNQVYRGRPQGRYWVLVLMSALAPTLLIFLMSDSLQQWWRLLMLYLKISIGG